MADKTEAEKAEEARRKGLTPAARAEEDRRAGLSQEDRDREDLAAMEAEEAAANARFNGQPGFDSSREAITKRLAEANATRHAKEATVEAVVARGRTVFTEVGQVEGHKPGTPVMLSPAEHAKLVQGGHILTDDGTTPEPVGPKVYSDAGLLQGHAQNQGQKSAK